MAGSGEGFEYFPIFGSRRIKVDHALGVLSSLEKMRKKPSTCDFTVKVGRREFPVHRSILVACSEYFRAMFESFMKESIEGSVDLKGLDGNSVEVCIDFMYTGDESLITLDNVSEVLHAATMLQLEKLQELCFEKLLKNLSEQNCISLLDIAQLYGHEILEKSAKKYFDEYFRLVVHSTEYQILSKDDALMYIIEFGSSDDAIWDAAASWIEYNVSTRAEDTIDFFNMMSLEEFPIDNLINRLWNAKYLQDSELCKEQLLKCVFSNVSRISEHISIKNWFCLNAMADSCDYVVQEIKDVICHFMLENFTGVLNDNNFTKLPKNDVVAMFQSPNAVYFASEKVKWNAMVRWLKGNPSTDSSTFTKLLESISLKSLPRKFLMDAMGNDYLSKKYPSCQKILEASIRQASLGIEENAIAILYEDGSIDTYEINEHKWLPVHFPASASIKITSMNKHLCLLEGRNLHINRRGKWVKQVPMSNPPQDDVKVLALQDMIYVLKNNSYSYFNAAVNSWSENLVLPPRFGKGSFFPVPAKNKIYLITSYSMHTLASPSNSIFEWLALEKGFQTIDSSQGFYCNGSIYFLGRKTSSITPSLSRYAISDKSWKTVTSPAMPSFKLFTVKNCLYACSCDCSNGVVLNEYNEKWDEWMAIKKSLKRKSTFTPKTIKSVCSYKSKPNRSEHVSS